MNRKLKPGDRVRSYGSTALGSYVEFVSRVKPVGTVVGRDSDGWVAVDFGRALRDPLEKTHTCNGELPNPTGFYFFEKELQLLAPEPRNNA